jgi:hypothetical protein
MRIARIDEALERCHEHLSETSAYGTEIESLLTYSILVLMCAEFERAIEVVLQEKCLTVADPSISAFFKSCVYAVFRSVGSSELAGLLNRFGPIYKVSFTRSASDNPIPVTFYNNIVINRHRVAHSVGSNATFREAKQFYEEGHVVLDFFRKALLSTGIDDAAEAEPT